MRVIKDYINNQVNLDNDYTNDELLALMSVYSDPKVAAILNMANFDNATIYSDGFSNIISEVISSDSNQKFDIIMNIANMFNVSMTDGMDLNKSTSVNKLKPLFGDNDLSVSLHSIIIFNKPHLVFNINGKYVCDFDELQYCPIRSDVYSCQDGVNIFASSYYAVVNIKTDIFNHIDKYYSTTGISFRPYYVTAHPTHIIYEFDSMDELRRSQKLFKSNRNLFNQIYVKYIVKPIGN